MTASASPSNDIIPALPRAAALRRLVAIVRKESLQIVRDPSTLLVAFALPVVMLFLFAYAVSLDTKRVPIGVVLESDAQPAQSLAAAFAGSRYFEVRPMRDRVAARTALVAGSVRGFVVIPQDMSRRVSVHGAGLVQIVTDGTQPNTAGFVASYAQGVVSLWQAGQAEQGGQGLTTRPVLQLEPRFWFNPELESRRALVPGAIAIVMTMIGTLLTALVVAREWERGTMEGLLSTPASVVEILFGKLLPYFVLGMVATAVSAALAVGLFGVPLRGSVLTLLLLSAVFLLPALGQGLLISALAKNQFVAAQIALLTAFLPAFLLSGFLFEIASMPMPIQWLTHLVAARWFNTALQTVFLAGDVWPLLLSQLGAMAVLGALYLGAAKARTFKRLDA